MNAAHLLQSILDGTYNPEFLSERKGQVAYAQTTRQMELVERRGKLLQDLLAGLECPNDGVNETTLPPTYSSPAYLFCPRPLHPEERRPPLLDLQWEWEWEESESSPPVFCLKPVAQSEVASVKNRRAITQKLPTQPPIGTGRPKPRVPISGNDVSDKPSFRLRPLPPCPQPQTNVSHNSIPFVPFGVFGKPVFTLPSKNESQQNVSSQPVEAPQVVVHDDQDKSSLKRYTEPRLSFLAFSKGQECHAY